MVGASNRVPKVTACHHWGAHQRTFVFKKIVMVGLLIVTYIPNFAYMYNKFNVHNHYENISNDLVKAYEEMIKCSFFALYIRYH